jgi:hypothetical protein
MLKENMRDLLFKNLTSNDHRKKVIVSSEIVDKAGVRTIVRRHFVYFVQQVQDYQVEKHAPYLFVLKEHNTKEKREKFYCRMKGNLYAIHNEKLYWIHFMHSIRINLAAIPEGFVKYEAKEGPF